MWVPDLMIGFLLAAHITTCLNYTHSYSTIAIPQIQQSLFTTIHTVYFQESSSPTAYSWNTQCNCRHSQLALYNYTLQSHYASLAHYRRLLKHFSAALPELLYTGYSYEHSNTGSLLVFYAHWLLTDSMLTSSLTLIHYCTLYFSTVLPELHCYWLTAFSLVGSLI
jgi:hypothetical protein